MPNVFLSMRDLIDIAHYEALRGLYIDPAQAGELLPPQLKWVHEEWMRKRG